MQFTETLLGEKLTFETSSKVFSPYKIDPGTRHLLENITLPENPKTILDLGAGYGAIGIVLAKKYPNAIVTFLDTDPVAIELCRENADNNHLPNSRFFKGPLSAVPEFQKYSVIISNLPWHSDLISKKNLPDLFANINNHLDINGHLFIITSNNFNLESTLEGIFDKVNIITEEKSYKLIAAVKLSEISTDSKTNLIKLLADNKITPDPQKGQHFLYRTDLIEKIVAAAEIQKNETVVEIGPGIGNITTPISAKAKKVIAIELDSSFYPFLRNLPDNVQVIYGNAWDILGSHSQGVEKFQKVVADLPYDMAESFMHKFTHVPSLKSIIFVLPNRFLTKIQNHHIFTAYFRIEPLFTIFRSSFYPVPDTDSVVVKITPLTKKLTQDNTDLWIRRLIYEHENALLKNILRTAVEVIAKKLFNKPLTKNEARKIVDALGINVNLLNLKPTGAEPYLQSSSAIKKFLLENQPRATG